jgi:hypothetical protein
MKIESCCSLSRDIVNNPRERRPYTSAAPPRCSELVQRTRSASHRLVLLDVVVNRRPHSGPVQAMCRSGMDEKSTSVARCRSARPVHRHRAWPDASVTASAALDRRTMSGLGERALVAGEAGDGVGDLVSAAEGDHVALGTGPSRQARLNARHLTSQTPRRVLAQVSQHELVGDDGRRRELLRSRALGSRRASTGSKRKSNANQHRSDPHGLRIPRINRASESIYRLECNDALQRD